MGNSESVSQEVNLVSAIDHSEYKPNILISPSQSYAQIRRGQSIKQLYPEIVKSVAKVKKTQSFEGIMAIVQHCPLYYLPHLGCHYQGQWLNCLPHGCGIAVYKNRSYYQGEFQKGQLESQDSLFYFSNVENQREKRKEHVEAREEGRMSTEHLIDLERIADRAAEEVSTYYLGKFTGSTFSGRGKLVQKDLVYDGEWDQGKRQGHGQQYSFQRNFNYEGQFVNGFKYGNGVYTRKIKDFIYMYEGTFYCGKFHGLGKLSIDGSLVFKGRFFQGRAQGEGTLICQEGTLKCQFVRDQVSGQGEFTFDDVSKDKIEGSFSQERMKNAELRRIMHEGKHVAKAVRIDFLSLLT